MEEEYINLVEEYISTLDENIEIKEIKIARVEDFKNDRIYGKITVVTSDEEYEKEFDLLFLFRYISDRESYEYAKQKNQS